MIKEILMLSTYLKITATAILGFLLTACGSEEKPADEKALQTQKQETHATVYKYDDSIQCEAEGIPLEDMRMELAKAGVDVICAQKAHDGFARIAVCGQATGNINTFVIHKANLPDVENLGFKSVNDLPDYQDTPCKS
jgi:hypothetical protein